MVDNVTCVSALDELEENKKRENSYPNWDSKVQCENMILE